MATSDMMGQPIIYAVRHGETELNAGNSFRGFVDVDLDDNGIEQAHEVKRFLADVPFVAAYSSDLKRAADTADIILKGRDIEAQRLATIRPWNVGMFAGKTKSAKNKALLKAYADDPNKPIPQGESLNEFRFRYQHMFQDKVKEAVDKGGPILIVQHASNDHEIGNIIYGDIDATDVEPGGVLVVYLTRLGLAAKPVLYAATEMQGYGGS